MDKDLKGKSTWGDVADGARGQRCTHVQLASELHMSEHIVTPSPLTNCPLLLRGAHVRDVLLAGETLGSRRIVLFRGDLLERSDLVGGEKEGAQFIDSLCTCQNTETWTTSPIQIHEVKLRCHRGRVRWK